MNAALENARGLARDAKQLLEAGSHARAMSLAALSIEEWGKLGILRSLALATNAVELQQYWKEYRTHTRKNAVWPILDLVAKGARTVGDLGPLFDQESDHPAVLDQLKQVGFYTDCYGKGRWSEPRKDYDSELARHLVQTAELLAGIRRERPVSAREIELWVEHLKPVWKRSGRWSKKAFADWRKAMQREGLSDEDDGFDTYLGFEDPE